MVTRLLGLTIPTALLLALGPASAAGNPPVLRTTNQPCPKQPQTHPSSPQQPQKPTTNPGTSPTSPNRPTTGTNTGMTRGYSTGRGGYGNQLGRINRTQSTTFAGQDPQQILPPVQGGGNISLMGSAPSGQTALDVFDAQMAAYLQQVQGSQYANANKAKTPATPATSIPTSTDLPKK